MTEQYDARGISSTQSFARVLKKCLELKGVYLHKHFGSKSEFLNENLVSYRSFLWHPEAIRYVIKAGSEKLDEPRKENPAAGGLIVASSVEHAFELLNILEKEFAKTATVVTYHDKQAISKIDRFRNGTTEWIVSVGMISEGTDIPRQQVWYHLSTVKTELYFRQILGRIVRINRFKNQEAWLFTIATQELTLFAERLAEELPEQYRIIQIENTLPAGATHIHASEPDVRKKEFRVIDTENGHSCNSMDLNGTGPKNASFDKPGTYFTINSLHQRVINAFLPTDSKH
ncbi:helicase-related protein (plasmid) [Enterobacter cloacae]|uniref:DEAD/DEAH box helicase n=1 Tax=Enterobacter cloacae TaxID=550 RepID=UPI0032AEAA8F